MSPFAFHVASVEIGTLVSLTVLAATAVLSATSSSKSLISLAVCEWVEGVRASVSRVSSPFTTSPLAASPLDATLSGAAVPESVMSDKVCVWLLSALLANRWLTVTDLVADAEVSTNGTTSSPAGVALSGVNSEIFLFAIGCPSNKFECQAGAFALADGKVYRPPSSEGFQHYGRPPLPVRCCRSPGGSLSKRRESGTTERSRVS